MSTKFVVVKQEPKDLPKGTICIKMPDFMDEINQNAGKEPRGGLTASHHLRSILDTVSQKYDPDLNAFRLKTHVYEGRAYKNNDELAKVVVEMLRDQHPQIFDRYLDSKIKSRPMSTKVIYFVGDFKDTTSFFKNGIDSMDEKEVDSYLNPKGTKGKAKSSDDVQE